MSFEILHTSGNASFGRETENQTSPFPKKFAKGKTPGKNILAKHKTNVEKRALSPMRNMELATSQKGAVDSQKNLDAVLRKNEALEEALLMLKYLSRIVPLSEMRWAAEKHLLAQRVKELEEESKKKDAESERQRLEAEQVERVLMERNLELQNKIDTLTQASRHEEAEDNKRMQAIRKERNELKKEKDSLARRLEKAEEYLRISKELSSNLQMEKQRLTEQTNEQQEGLASAKSAIKSLEEAQAALNTQVERERAELNEMEGRLHVADEELSLVERQLFQSMVVSIKLEKMVMGLQVTYAQDTESLYDKAKEQGLTQRQWGLFLRDELEGDEETEVGSKRSRPSSLRKESLSKRRRPTTESKSLVYSQMKM